MPLKSTLKIIFSLTYEQNSILLKEANATFPDQNWTGK